MRAAFAAQYKKSFRPATDTSWSDNVRSSGSVGSSTSRAAAAAAGSGEEKQCFDGSRKKSRWQ